MGLKTQELASELITQWNGDPRSLKHAGGTNHDVFYFTSSQTDLVLRLTPTFRTSSHRIVAEIAWVSHLLANNVPVNTPVKPAGQSEFVLSAKTPTGQPLTAAVFSRLSGERVRVQNPKVWNQATHFVWGKVLGRIHSVARAYTPEKDLQFERFNGPALVTLANDLLPESRCEVIRRLETVSAQFSELPMDKSVYGLIHGDCTPGNMMLKESQIALYDFDDSCYHWFIQDIAIPIFIVSFLLWLDDRTNWRSRMKQFWDAFLDGYLAGSDNGLPMKDHLPLFLTFFEQLVWITMFTRKVGIQQLSMTPMYAFIKNVVPTIKWEELLSEE